jgi:Protein of unknown function (DUF2934)
MSKRTNGKTSETSTPTPAPRARKAPAAPAAAAPKATRSRKKAAPVTGSTNGNGHQTSIDAPSYEDIATRAYFIALERGFQSDPLADWLLAEQQLREHAGS